MPVELFVVLLGAMLLGLCFLAVMAVGVVLYRRTREQRYGEPPTWMVAQWRRKAADRQRRREADERLLDLVEEHEDPGDE